MQSRLCDEYREGGSYSFMPPRTCACNSSLLPQVDCQPKITDLELHGSREQHIFRFDIAVRDAVLVQIVEAVEERVQNHLDSRLLRELSTISEKEVHTLVSGMTATREQDRRYFLRHDLIDHNITYGTYLWSKRNRSPESANS